MISNHPLLSVTLFSRNLPFATIKQNIDDFLAEGNDINSQNEQGRTMLHLAYICDREDVGKYLIESKIDDSIIDNQGRTAENILSEHKRIEATKTLPRVPSPRPQNPVIIIDDSDDERHKNGWCAIQ